MDDEDERAERIWSIVTKILLYGCAIMIAAHLFNHYFQE
jgi:hypothetical protein